MNAEGRQAYSRIADLLPLNRSLTGEGVRQTLSYIQKILPDLRLHEIASGTPVYDWTVPKEWAIREAWIEFENGERVVDFKDHNLHVVGYSEPVSCEMSLEELQNHLHSRPDMPDAIPYVTSYYKQGWGFCLTHKQRAALKPGRYRVHIDSELKNGSMSYADLVIQGKTQQEILLSTYICHPSMTNNELSGPAVAVALAEWLRSIQPSLRYSYRIVFVPETVGAIAYIHQNIGALQENVVAGYVLTCMGDDRTYSFMPTPWGQTLADRITRDVLKHEAGDYQSYSFLERGSDERQYCSPRVGLPVVSVMRSKYREYPEYHTSLDDMSVVSPVGLQGSIDMLRRCVLALEGNGTYISQTVCEPMLGKRGLYFNEQAEERARQKMLFDLIAYCDGRNDLLAIAEHTGYAVLDLVSVAQIGCEHGLLERVE